MENIKSLVLIFCIMLGLAHEAFAQPAESLIKVQVTPDHADWLYKPGEKVRFNIAVLRCDIPQSGIEVRYEISEDMMTPHITKTVKTDGGKVIVDAGTMKKEGFLRCCAFVKYGGREYEGRGTVGFSPEKLRPVTTVPDDFRKFWDDTKAAARKWPLNPIMTLLPERCTDKVDVYHVSYANNGYESRIYGMLSVPKKPGRYPAILKLPGAGIRAYNGDTKHSEKGFIILEIGIHGIPVNLQGEVYHRLYNGPLKNYHSFNMESRDLYYYKRVFTGCVRSIDFIYTLPSFNGKLATFGGSQGGGLSIITAGLDDRVNGLVSYYPAMCDMAGYGAGRAGGWPHTFKDEARRTPEALNTIRYYDAANFARQIHVPGFYTFGYNDMVCPPTTTYSTYNVIDAPKELFVAETTAHYAYAEQGAAAWQWVMDFLTK